MNTERYSRQIMLPEIGSEGQQRLSQASVLIVGGGGLGTPVAGYLGAAGIGRIGIVDNDTVSVSNLQRQILYTEAQTGMPKTGCAAARLRAVNSSLVIDEWPLRLDAGNAADIIGRYDIVADCTDNYATRFIIDDACAALGKVWVHAAIGPLYGQVCVFGGTRRRRLSMLWPEREALCAMPPTVKAALGPVAGTIGAIEALEVIKAVVGIASPLDGALFTIDFKTMQSNIIEF